MSEFLYACDDAAGTDGFVEPLQERPAFTPAQLAELEAGHAVQIGWRRYVDMIAAARLVLERERFQITDRDEALGHPYLMDGEALGA